MVKEKLQKWSEVGIYISIIIGLIGANTTALLILLVPNEPVGYLFFITILPLIIGGIGLCLSFIVYLETKN